MAESILDVAHHVLQVCANKGADGYYPRVDGLGLDRTQLDATLDMLRLGGFIEIADWSAGKGQGYRLTDAGTKALHRPDLLKRPAAGQRPTPEALDPAEEVRRAVLSPPPAIVTRILVAVNIAVYVAVCVYNLVLGRSIFQVISAPEVLPGSLWSFGFFVEGHWWLLLTYSFLHGSPMHILMNMFCLGTLGNIMEDCWGWKRYLILYFGSGLIAGVVILFTATDPVRGTVGASGAICGLLTSLAVWAWMHRRYLPPQFVEADFRMVGLNLIIVVGIGFVLPNISMAGHIGGAVGGAILSVPLAWLSRAAPLRHRVLGAIALLLIAGTCVLVLAMAPKPVLFVGPGVGAGWFLHR